MLHSTFMDEEHQIIREKAFAWDEKGIAYKYFRIGYW